MGPFGNRPAGRGAATPARHHLRRHILAGWEKFSHGLIRLVARAGSVIPGAGTIAYVFPQGTGGVPYTPSTPFSGAAINDSGEVAFQATLTGQPSVGVLLLAKPHG